MEVEAVNVAGARVGDQILLRIESGAVLKVSFLLYIFPLDSCKIRRIEGYFRQKKSFGMEKYYF